MILLSDEEIRVGGKPLDDYLVSVAILFNQGKDRVILKGRGNNISKAVALYNALKNRMGEALELVDVRIGSEDLRGKIVSYIEIEVRRAY